MIVHACDLCGGQNGVKELHVRATSITMGGSGLSRDLCADHQHLIGDYNAAVERVVAEASEKLNELHREFNKPIQVTP